MEKTDIELALKVNKFIHEQCIDGVPHDIGWNTVKLIRVLDGELLKAFCKYCEDRQIEPKRFKWDEIIKDFELEKL